MVSPTLRSTRPGVPICKDALKGPTVDVKATVTSVAGNHTVDEAAADEFDKELGLVQGEAVSPTPAGVGTPPGVTLPSDSTEVATRPQQQVSRMEQESDGALSGEWAGSDIKFPALKIVNGSGPLSQTYNQGTLLFGDEVLFTPPDNPKTIDPKKVLRFVPVSLRKRYRQNLTPEESADGAFPEIVDTAQEVEERGGSVAWIGGQKPSWSPCATMLALVEQPAETEHPGFSLEIGGKFYAFALYYASGSGYTHSAKLILNTALSSLRIPVLDAEGKTRKSPTGFVMTQVYLSKNFWSFRVTKRQVGQYVVFGPELKMLREETGPELREVIRSVLEQTDMHKVAAAAGE